jgi:heterodisulfide reductase subunit A-like polyferredoxin
VPELEPVDGIGVTRWGTLSADPETCATDRPGVFAGGDAVSGPSTVIEAIAAGHKAALGIENYLRGLRGEAPKPQSSYLPAVKLTQEEVSAKVDKGDIVLRQRVESKAVPVAQRLANPIAEYDLGLTEEQALAEAERCLSCGICSECLECVYACGPKAIDHDERERDREINVGAVIVAAGYDVYDARLSEEFGHGRYPNVITSLQFERVLSASGPSQGHVQRPSDGQEPRRIAFLQCIGSRDQKHDYCSAVCCMYATKEAILAKEHLPGVDCQVFVVDMRAFGKNFDAYFERAKREYGVNYVRCRPSSLKEVPSTRNLLLRYQTEEGELKEEEFDLVVLSVGMEPAQGARELARTLGIELDSNGFCAVSEFTPLESSVPGIYVCGPFAEPMDIPDSVTQGSGAAANALALLSPARGTLVKPKEYPPEMDVAGQEPRVGVFICHCGSNIAGVVDVEKAVEYARALPGVVYAERNLFTCSQDAQENIKVKIAELGLNRVVVASCTPRTHEPIFQETMREAGLNPYYFEMANIRDQCSWVHSKEPREATVKAMDLLRMAVARARLLQPLHREPMGLQHQALVIGGGPAGLTAALSLAGQGFAVSLVEREKELGGHLRRLPYSLQETGTREFLERLVRDVESHPLIRAFKDAEVLDTSGFVGNFQSTVLTGRSTSNGDRRKVEIGHGATIVATGAREYRGQEYLLGQAPQVITQQDLMDRIAQGPASLAQARDVVMIQCVGPGPGREWYCSRLCCTVAINNALKVKELNPQATVYVLYKDIRTYGFRERLYTQAREKGIIFVRYTDAAPPQVAESAGRLTVKVADPVLREELELPADLLVLATALVPSEGADSLAPLFKIPQIREGFFLEAHVKLRPVDFAAEGIFLCGSAHYPKFLSEAIAQGYAAAARAATILSKPQLMVGGVVAVVDEARCVGCLTCVRACPYKVPRINAEKRGVGGLLGAAEIAVAQCQGCGVCAAECPAKAIQLLHYRDEQVLAKTEALFAEVCA